MRSRKNRRKLDQEAVRTAARGLAVRVARFVGGALLLGGVITAGAYGGSALKTWLLTSPTFALDAFAFEGLARASDAELLALAGLKQGDNIFEADLLAAERGMGSHPWVKKVAIERSYPRALRVQVLEHQPAALAEMGRLYYVSEAGKVFKKLSPGEESDLPIFSGLSREDFAAHEQEYEELFREGLEALSLYREAGLEQKAPVSEVKVSRDEGFTFFCGKDAAAVLVGFKDYREKFGRLGRLYDELSRRGAKAEVIRLDNRTRPGWVAVQLAEVQKQQP